MTDEVNRREFDKLYDKVESQSRELTETALDIREIKTTQKNDSEKIGKIFDSMEKMANNVTLNKTQIAKLVAWATPINAVIAYGLSRFLVK